MDNTWLTQPVFFNNNFTRTIPNSKKLAYLKSTFYGLNDTFHKLTVEQMYPGGVFIGKKELETLIGAQMIPLSYISLKTHIKSKIGPNKKYNGVSQKKNTHNSIASLMESIKSGSGQHRKIIMRDSKIITQHPRVPGEKN